MPPIDDAVVELLLAERAIRSLGKLRQRLTPTEQMKLAEMMRDAADQIDDGIGTLPSSQDANTTPGTPSPPTPPEPAPPPEQSPKPESEITENFRPPSWGEI